jgi:hypothetical protein
VTGFSEDVVRQIDALLQRVVDLKQTSRYEDLSDHPDDVLMQVRTRYAAAIERFSAPSSEYRDALARSNEHWLQAHNFVVLELAGVLTALRDDYADGYMTTVVELVHGQVFDDFLGMAEELLEKNFDAPAAVLTGSVLEEHLSKLATKHGIPLVGENSRPRSAEALGIELVKRGVFPETQRKVVTGWYGQRNDAAHGRHSDLDHGELRRMLDGVRDFLARFPA